MATSRVFQDLISGVTDADPGAAGVTLSAPFLADLAVVASPEYIALTLDPEEVFGDPEIVHVTVHTASATTATIERGKEGTSGIAHAIGTKVIAASTAAGLSGLLPVGSITMYGGAAAPDSYLLCNGQSLDTTAYAALFAVVGYAYGGSGANFNIPDMRQRFPLGKATSGTGASLGDSGGGIDHTHVGAAHTHTMPTHIHTMPTHIHQVPSHNHTNPGTSSEGAHNHSGFVGQTTPQGTSGRPSYNAAGTGHFHAISNDGSHTHSQGSVSTKAATNTTSTDPGDTNATDPGNTNSAGAGVTSQNNPPFLAVNFIIKAV